MIGEVRPSELPRLMQWAGAAGLEEHRILVTGRLATEFEVNEHLRLCDVYLQPSLWDGMPNALLEAMSAGCAVIGSDAGGIPELITDGVRRNHRSSLAVASPGRRGARVARTRPEHSRERMKQAARERMIRDFGPEQERGQLQALLGRLIPSSS